MGPVFHQKVERLDEEVSFLERNRERFVSELPMNAETRRLVERAVYLCAEMVLDVADLIIVARGWPKPATYREAIDKLGERGVLPAEFAHRFAYVAGLRNFLAHDYLKDTRPALQEFLAHRLPDFRAYIEKVRSL